MADLEAWVYEHLDVRQRLGDEINCVCPKHQSASTTKADLWVNANKRVFGCFSSACKFCGPAWKLVQFVTGGTPDQAKLLVGSELPGTLRLIDAFLAGTVELDFPFRISQAQVDEKRSERYWAEERGLSSATISHFQLGYDPELESALIPYVDGSGPVCFVQRRHTRPKYIYPKSFPMRRAIFNLQAVDPSSEVVVCEGAIDAMKVWEAGYHNVVALWGSAVTIDQVRLLAHLRLVSFFDRDPSGISATLRLFELYQRLFRVARYPTSSLAKDPAELTPEEVLGAIDRAILSTEFIAGVTSEIAL